MILRNKFDALQEISEIQTLNEEYENFVNTRIETELQCIPTKLSAKHRVPWKTLAIKKKRDDVKTASLCNRRKPTNANAQKLKKAKSELMHTKKNK